MKLKLTNYRVIQKIGHGGMGLVYVAEDLALGRLVALKVLAPYLVQDPEIIERFRTEARNQARLVHPNITMVYSFLEEEGQAFLVLEFIDGETLESRINREGRITAVEAVAIFRKILAAIAYAHSKGVIHRDIKPGNIAFTSDGHVKLMDFGIALNIEEGGRLTRTGHVMGTPHYMAPEQILGQDVTFATDIYALGITLYEMITGRLPFDSKSDYEVRIAQVNHPPPPPRSFGFPDITAELEEVLLKSLAKAPKDRFAGVGEFLQDLEDAVEFDHAVTVVKGRRLDRNTQAVKRPRKSAPPPSEPERAEPPAPSPEPEIDASVPALASPMAEPIVPPAAEVPPEEHSTPLSLGPQLAASPSPHPDEAEEPSGSPPLEPQIEAPPISPPVRPHEAESPALKFSERPEISVSPLIEALEEPRVSAPAEMHLEEQPSPAPETRLDQIVVPPLVELPPAASPASGQPEAEAISALPELEPDAGLPVSSLPDLLIAEPPTPPPEAPTAEPAVPSASLPQTEAPVVPPPAEVAQEELSTPISVETQPGESPGPHPAEGQEFSLSQPPEQMEDLLASPPPEPPQEAPPAPPSEGQIEEISAPLCVEPQLAESPAVGHPVVREAPELLATGQIEESRAPIREEPEQEPPSPPPGVPSEDHFGPETLGELIEDAVTPSEELPQQALSPTSPSAPPIEEPAERLLEIPASSPPPEEIDEPSGPSLFEPPREAPSSPAPEADLEGPPSPPPPEADRQESFTPSLSGQGVEEVSVPPPVEVPRKVAKPKTSPFKEQPSQEPATLPVPEGPWVTPEVQRGKFARSRLIFLPLALLPLLALIILFRAHIFPGPSVTPKAILSPPPVATAAKQGAPPVQPPVEKLPVAAAKPSANQPLNPVFQGATVSTGAESAQVVRDQPEKKAPVAVAALPSAEKTVEAPKVEVPKPVDLQKTIKERLAADGFPDLQVRMDAKKGAVISGKVKTLVQKNRIIQMVNSMGLSTSVDYSNLKIPREVVVETIKKKVQEERPRITRTPEAPPRSAPPEAPRKPLPPRLDRGNIQF
ncbi:MAG: protein kinase [Deltaproteobacteria bacterium]|nr:protein kinase [Deltaproteobacteria bacterium]